MKEQNNLKNLDQNKNQLLEVELLKVAILLKSDENCDRTTKKYKNKNKKNLVLDGYHNKFVENSFSLIREGKKYQQKIPLPI
uniref:Uncharacterized protein n=1 Tax=Meloidogyne incognita TaxID=6306 RepID=A0A914N2S9_MELIC